MFHFKSNEQFSCNYKSTAVFSVAMNKSVKKTLVGLDHQNTPGKTLYQFDAHVYLTMGEQRLAPIPSIQWHKRKIA